jgi:OOP family OmpA-OmpF porin
MMRAAILAAGVVALGLLAVLCFPRHLPSQATSASLTQATFHARFEQGILTLRGSLPTESGKAAILRQAQQLYGSTAGHLIDQLTVDPDLKPAAWAEQIPAILPVLGQMTERGSIIIDGRSIVLSGRVDNDQVKASVLRDIDPLVQAGLNLEDYILTAPHQAATVPLQKKLTDLLSHASIEFDSNTATLTPRGRATLDRLTALLQKAPQTAIEIGGHTDKYGAPGYNLELSRRRAETVRRYFLNHSLTHQFTTVGYGASRPLSSAQTKAGFQHNRRIELRVKGPSPL